MVNLSVNVGTVWRAPHGCQYVLCVARHFLLPLTSYEIYVCGHRQLYDVRSATSLKGTQIQDNLLHPHLQWTTRRLIFQNLLHLNTFIQELPLYDFTCKLSHWFCRCGPVAPTTTRSGGNE